MRHRKKAMRHFTVKFLFALAPLAPLTAKQLTVCAQCSLQSPAAAVAAAKSGDTVFIKAGHYNVGTLVIAKPLTIKGEKNTVLDGQAQGHVIAIRADDVVVAGVTIVNPGISDIKEYAAIHVENSRRCTLRQNTLENATYGIYLAKSEGCTISQNTSYGNAKDEIHGGNGIHLWYSNNNTLSGNTLAFHRDGLYFEFSERLRVSENSATKNIRYGLHFMFCHYADIEKNRFFENATGTALMYSKHLLLKENRFNGSQAPGMQGVLLKDIIDSKLEQNVFFHNTTGLLVDNSSRNSIDANLFEKNGLAVEALGSSQDNVFMQNTFNANIFDVATNTRENTNRYENNFWDKYKGFDLDGDGKGDIAYAPVQIFSFWVSKYPELSILAGSSMVQFLETIEKAFPVLTPATLKDTAPLMKPPTKGA